MSDDQPIVFIHGMFMTPLCWASWIERFSERGRVCIAPAWPGRDLPVEELWRAHPDPRLASLTLTEVVDSYEERIRDLPLRPILVGHSMGGLVAQLLLQRGLAAAAVAIDSAPPRGVLTARWSFLRANWPLINPLVGKRTPMTMSFERFQFAFANTLDEGEQRRAFGRYMVPESRRVPAGALTGAARIDFDRPHAPLLFIAGSDDHVIPASLNFTNFRKYRHAASVTDFREFGGRSHLIIDEPGWEAVADAVDEWLANQGAPSSEERSKRPAVEAGVRATAH